MRRSLEKKRRMRAADGSQSKKENTSVRFPLVRVGGQAGPRKIGQEQCKRSMHFRSVYLKQRQQCERHSSIEVGSTIVSQACFCRLCELEKCPLRSTASFAVHIYIYMCQHMCTPTYIYIHLRTFIYRL